MNETKQIMNYRENFLSNGSDKSSNASKSSILEFYKDTNVFLTGATGFVGKALLEKLLRTCQVETVYILMRSKRGTDPKDRLKELFNNSVFDLIKEKSPEVFDKVRLIEGDISMENLGISEKERILLYSKVDIVFHSAANVRFDEKFNNAIKLNALGTKRMLDLCCRMNNLKSFVHVSTAFSNADKKEIEEIVYETPYNPKLIIDCVLGLSDEIVEVLSRKMLERHPNSYTFSKAMAECIVQEYSVILPVAIVRPSIVTASWKEPFPGWVDNIFGVTGIMAEISRGSVRSAYGNPKIIMDIIPVDTVVNTILTAAWHTVAYNQEKIRVYNCTSGSINRIYWKDLGTLTKRYAMEYPTKYLNWYPEFNFHTNHLLHRMYEIFLHRTLAYISDAILYCIKKKPTMLKLCKKFERLNVYTQHFTFGEWRFHVRVLKELVEDVKKTKDGICFDLDISPENGLNWESYFKDYVIGIRKFILKEKLDNGVKNKIILRGFYWANLAVQIFSLYILLRLLTFKSYLSVISK